MMCPSIVFPQHIWVISINGQTHVGNYIFPFLPWIIKCLCSWTYELKRAQTLLGVIISLLLTVFVFICVWCVLCRSRRGEGKGKKIQAIRADKRWLHLFMFLRSFLASAVKMESIYYLPFSHLFLLHQQTTVWFTRGPLIFMHVCQALQKHSFIGFLCLFAVSAIKLGITCFILWNRCL